MMTTEPATRPGNPCFSSGPCAKRPGWTLETLDTTSLGRSHRATIGKSRLKTAIERTKAILRVPDDYLCGIVPASDTGAYEMAMWTMLGARPVDALGWDSFGGGWITDVTKQLKLPDARVIEADYGALPDLSQVRPDADILFTWNGTTSGVRVPNADWIPADRAGLTLCDATSAAFAQALDWEKLDVTTFSWQKALGGEAQHGIVILSPRAVARLESHTPPWPIPKIFRLTKGGRLIEGIFEGETINTPSMLCVEDYLDALGWAESIGGLTALHTRADTNLATLARWVENRPWIEFLAAAPETRSNTSVCLKIIDPAFLALDPGAQRDVCKRIAALLEARGIAFDINGYRDAPPGLRIWTGCTVESHDVEALTPWLDWAYAAVKPASADAAGRVAQ